VRHYVFSLAIPMALVACAGPRAATTTVSAASVHPTPSSESAPAQPSEPEAAPARPDAPPGEVACRFTRPLDGKTELYLEWAGKEASGTLRTVAPSGVVHDRKVHAEHYKDKIIVDDPNSDDLVVHLAILKGSGPKARILVGDESAWSTCE
jgi:hypothetical protein